MLGDEVRKKPQKVENTQCGFLVSMLENFIGGDTCVLVSSTYSKTLENAPVSKPTLLSNESLTLGSFLFNEILMYWTSHFSRVETHK